MNQNTTAVGFPAFTQNMMPALPEELRNQLAAQFGGAMDSFGGGFNRISLKNNRISLIVGGNKIREDIHPIDIIIIGMAAEQYCAWYEKKYTGEEGIAPSAVWAQNETPPAHVPASVLQKDAEGRNQYAVRRRIVCVAYETTPAGYMPNWENLFVFDVGGSSCFGDKLPLPNGQGEALSLSGYINALKSSGVYPNCIPTRVVLDGRSSVPEVRFMPHRAENGAPMMLPVDAITQSLKLAMDANTAAMLDWRRAADQAAPAPEQPQQPNQYATATATPSQAQNVAQTATQTVAAQTTDFTQAFNDAPAFDAQQPMQQPVQQPMQQPVQQPMQQPVQQTMQQPVQQTMQQPVQQVQAAQPLNTIAPEPTQQPAMQNLVGQMNGAVTEQLQPVQQQVQQPVQQPVQQVQQPVQQVQQPAQQPVQQVQTAQQPVQQQPESAQQGLQDALGDLAKMM